MKQGKAQICLASASPRRRELLDQIGVSYRVQAANIDETPLGDELPEKFVQRMALSKARTVQRLADDGAFPVLGADTIVVAGGIIMGKPGCRDEAFAMWRQLSGTCHSVITAIALVADERSAVMVSASDVSFRAIGEQEMRDYWDGGEPIDKAGGYAIQGLGAIFVSHLQGSYSGVMGLPLYETDQLLRRFGIKC